MIYKLQLRRDTEANWNFSNPVLSEAEVGIITDTSPLQVVVGDGNTPFSGLTRYYIPSVESGEFIQGFVYIDDLAELSPDVNQLGWCYDGKLYTYVGTGGDTFGGKYQYQGPFGARGFSAYEIAVQHGFVGTEEEWLLSLKGETGDEYFKSTIFCRMNVDIQHPITKPADTDGSWSNPAPHVAAGTDSEGNQAYWEDGIPAGENQIWACSRTFSRSGRNDDEHWSTPRQMTDVEGLYNVEFAKKQPGDVKPADPVPGENGNMHGCVPASNQVWFDPQLDSTEDFSQMYWQAEQWISNGVVSNWTVVRIKGERGERGDGQSSYKSVIFCRMNNTPTKPSASDGSWDDPAPHVAAGTDSEGNTAYWLDGIPAGTNKIWACSRTFSIDGQYPQDSAWSDPREMTDIKGVFDVEFAKMQTPDVQPPVPNGTNQHGGSGPQIWYDPVLDASEDFATMFWRAERMYDNGVAGDWVITRIKGEKGSTGDTGSQSAIAMLYKRSATTPLKPSLDPNWPSESNVLYYFSDGSMTGVPAAAGWVPFSQIPAGTDPIWAIAATAYAAGSASYDSITRNEWSDPVEMGSVGADGLNATSLILYKRSASTPLAFSVQTEFDFEHNILSDGTNNLTPTSGNINGWSRYVPAVEAGSPYLPVWQISAAAISSTLRDTIAYNEWSNPAQIGGGDGKKTAVVYLYQRSASLPAGPSASSTYDFTTNSLTSDIGNWSRSIPSGSNPLYVVAATAYAVASENTDVIESNEWSSPVILAENGTNGRDGTNGTNGRDGTDGDDGINSATVFLYQRSSSVPSKPNVSMTYVFATGVIKVGSNTYPPTSTSNVNRGWSRTIPSGSDQCYVIQATALSTTAQDTIGTSEWSSPAELVKNGTDGAQGPEGIAYRVTVWGTNIVYKDGTGSGSPRIIDVVTNKDIAFITDSDFGAWECISGHTSVANELPAIGSSNSKWRAYALSNPLVTPLLLANTINARYIDVGSLVAGQVKTVGGANTLNTLIRDGMLRIYLGAINENNLMQNCRAAFGIEGGDVVLKFYDDSGNELYDLGPNGITHLGDVVEMPEITAVKFKRSTTKPSVNSAFNWETWGTEVTLYKYQDGRKIITIGGTSAVQYYNPVTNQWQNAHSPLNDQWLASANDTTVLSTVGFYIIAPVLWENYPSDVILKAEMVDVRSGYTPFEGYIVCNCPDHAGVGTITKVYSRDEK